MGESGANLKCKKFLKIPNKIKDFIHNDSNFSQVDSVQPGFCSNHLSGGFHKGRQLVWYNSQVGGSNYPVGSLEEGRSSSCLVELEETGIGVVENR